MISAKSSYEEQLVFDYAYSNSNKIFVYVQSLTNHSVIPPNVHFNDQYASSDTDRANQYFHSVFTHSPYVLPPVSELPSPDSSLINIYFSDSDVYSALVSLNETKAMGIDVIQPIKFSNIVLSLCMNQFIIYFISVCNRVIFLLNGVFIRLSLYPSQGTKLLLLIIAQSLCFAPFLKSLSVLCIIKL